MKIAEKRSCKCCAKSIIIFIIFQHNQQSTTTLNRDQSECASRATTQVSATARSPTLILASRALVTRPIARFVQHSSFSISSGRFWSRLSTKIEPYIVRVP